MMSARILALTVVLLALPGCCVETAVSSLACNDRNVATYHLPSEWPCWRPNKVGDGCALTVKANGDACDAPEHDDSQIFSGGQTVEMWCPYLVDSEDGERFLVPVYCDDASPVYDEQGTVRR